MEYPHPSTFSSDLTDERLGTIAAKMLDVRYLTIRQMDTEFDDNYTRECPVYGRTRNMLIALARNKELPWLSVKCMGMGVEISIVNVKCKFFRDDVENPEKAGFFKRDGFLCLFEEEDNVPLLWRFVIERALTEEDEDQIYFVGYNKFNEKISMWHYEGGAAPLYSVDQVIPPAANMGPAEIDVREAGEDDLSNSSEEDSNPATRNTGTDSAE
ncbi:hypothetical protein [Duganella violaceipulchra]|uniref:Uncharacterized protein n=1 Tax=Duganella violaceipulchra TaxID=2849652 RepID=A0AA41L8N3_9BURK|nr:hypothetical protein [Duganella violaceicalia]MBV6325512.1 hypothetical protein [Duganella violaceicalia]MCP2012684.1 hypothetical protein [Duganella violaceicalia]